MKHFFESLFSFIISLIVIAGIVVIGWFTYNILFGSDKISTVNTEDTLIPVDTGSDYIEKTEKRSMGETIKDIFTPTTEPEVETYSTENSKGNYFYEQLSDTQKIIYNGLQENKDKLKTGTYSIQFGNKFSKILEQENGSKALGDDYQTAIEAYTHDNADLFYIDISKLFLNIETKKKAFSTTYNVYIGPSDNQTYYANGFSSEADVNLAFEKIEQVKNTIKSKITGNTYKDIKTIHDYLIENVEYDENNVSIGTYTIYGALVEKKCVCEGYAKAFKYLADKVGIDCILMQGVATNSNGNQEKHAWNAVNINGIWYLIDVTWDDPIIIGKGRVTSSTYYKYFLKGTQAFYKDHTPEYNFSTGGKEFNYPTISKSDF